MGSARVAIDFCVKDERAVNVNWTPPDETDWGRFTSPALGLDWGKKLGGPNSRDTQFRDPAARRVCLSSWGSSSRAKPARSLVARSADHLQQPGESDLGAGGGSRQARACGGEPSKGRFPVIR
jgi:hypothetical protein